MSAIVSRWKAFLLVAGLVTGLAGCGGGGINDIGRLQLSLSDASTDLFRAVYVTILEVQVHFSEDPANTLTTIASPETTFDLLALVNGSRAELGVVDLISGHYDAIRLVLGSMPDNALNILGDTHPFANYVIDSLGVYHELKVPSALNSEVRVVQGFEIKDNATTELLIDFSAPRSVVLPGQSGDFLLEPSIRVFDLTLGATVNGRVTKSSDQTIVPGAVVSAQIFDRAATDLKDQVIVETSTVSDMAGDYKFVLGANTYELVASKPGYAADVFERALSSDTTETQNFSLTAVTTGILSGTVTISGAESDSFATVSFRRAVIVGGIEVMIEVASVNVGAGGTYSVPLAPGSYKIVAFATGRMTQSEDVVINVGPVMIVDFAF